jgi:hypothetical protein
MRQDTVVASLEVLFQYWSGVTERNHHKLVLVAGAVPEIQTVVI